MKLTGWLSAGLVTLFTLSASSASPNPPESPPQGWIESALLSISSTFRENERWDYLMNVRVRLLLFWVGADDVGGGYIAKGELPAEPGTKAVKLVIGSDPLKAPRKINHWGSAVEIRREDGMQSTFFGFMKSSKATSAKDAEAETSKGTFGFEASINHAARGEAFSRVVPLISPQDFTFRDLALAQQAMIQRVSGRDGPFRHLATPKAGCSTTSGFLNAVDQMIEQVLDNRTSFQPLCYVHNARYYTITLKKTSRVKSHTAKVKLRNGGVFERSYKDLISSDFEIFNTESKERTRFDLLVGTSGELRGTPVQIHYQPNWWFQVVLHLDTRNPH